ncbi:hypothetical protein [Microbacterium sp. MMO-10]|uniref:hypothetical protein n=1 Tax=Microbacterium sp. MMO-10 TaxID=3081272 RepID=UPI00301899BD
MANIFQKGQKFASNALALLQRQIKTPALFVHKYGIADFTGAEGDVLNFRRPPILRARKKNWRGNDAIVVDDIVKTKIQIALNEHPYSAVFLSPEEATLDEVEYGRDIQQPQVRAVLEDFEETTVNALRNANYVLGVVYNPASGNAKESDPRKVAVWARKLFQDKYVPTSGRYWFVGSSVSAEIASYDKLQDVDVSGLPEALRDGVVGKLGGFIIVEIDALGESESFFVHESALAVAAVAPVVPQGAAKGGGVAAGQGLAVTQVWDYDGTQLKDRSVVHAFTGATPITDPEIGADGRLKLDENGAPQMEFVRAIKVTFGPASGSAKYTVSGLPGSGTFTLTVDGSTTDPIPFNATNQVIADEINELQGVSGAKVTGSASKTVVFTENVTMTGTGVTVAAA